MKSISVERRQGRAYARDTLLTALRLLEYKTQKDRECAQSILSNLYETSKSHPNAEYAAGIRDVMEEAQT